MTPESFLHQLERKGPEPAYLFVGPDLYRRDQCRKALIGRFLDLPERESGYVRHDLDEISLSAVLDDLNSLSLFAGRRVVVAGPAESAVPRARGSASESDKAAPGAEDLASYLGNPAPGTVLVIDSTLDLEGDDKPKADRVRKFFAAITAAVEFTRMDVQAARQFARQEAARAGLKISVELLDLLVESVGADASRIAAEIEKLALFRGRSADVQADDITALVPDAREATIFNLVNAIASGNRRLSLDKLDTLVRCGEYLPLALTFLGGIFRLALAAQAQGLRSANDVQSYFQRQGVAMWRSRAEQVAQVSNRLPGPKLAAALEACFTADNEIKSTRPDDRLVFERFLLAVTK